jgi:hypothetical protein
MRRLPRSNVGVPSKRVGIGSLLCTCWIKGCSLGGFLWRGRPGRGRLPLCCSTGCFRRCQKAKARSSEPPLQRPGGSARPRALRLRALTTIDGLHLIKLAGAAFGAAPATVRETRGSSATPSPLPGAAAGKLNYSTALLIGRPSSQRQPSMMQASNRSMRQLTSHFSFCSLGQANECSGEAVSS